MKMSQANRKAPVKTGGTTDEPSREPGAAQRGWDTRQQWGEGKTKLKAEARARLSRAEVLRGAESYPGALWRLSMGESP